MRMRLALRNRAFIFFSLVFPLVFLFLFLGLFARGNVGCGAVHAGVGAGADGHGQLLGTERAAGDLPRAGHSAAVSRGAGGRGRHAGLQHPFELHHDAADGDH